MVIANTMRSALVAAALGAATAVMITVVVLPVWAQGFASDLAVSIHNFTFAPQTLTVKAGSTVTWNNKDDTVHGIASDNNAFPNRKHWTPTTYMHSRSRRPAPTSTSATFIRT
jgi:plastocyanin